MFVHGFGRLVEKNLEMDAIATGDVSPEIGTDITDEDVRDASMILESFLIHARVLRDFFCRRRQRTDDVVAADFVNGWVPPSPLDFPYVHANKIRLDKALAHLTTTRVEYENEGKYWKVHEIFDEIEKMIIRFLDQLPEERKPWFISIEH